MKVVVFALKIIVVSLLLCQYGFSQSAPDYLWVKGSNSDRINVSTAIGSDSEGNVYVTGHFMGSYIQFGSTTLYNSGVGLFDLYLVKYDVDGNVLWAKSYGGDGDDYAYALAIDKDDNVFVTGRFTSSTMYFGTASLNNASTYSDVFLAKYDSQGNVLWVRAGNGTQSDDIGTGVCTDGDGNVYVGGRYGSNTLSFGTTTITNTTQTNEDAFIVKYDAAGTVIWAKTAGGSGRDIAYAIASDSDGNIFLTGNFNSEDLTFGTTVLSRMTGGGGDVFLAKYKNDGTVLWAKSANGLGEAYTFSVAADKDGNVFITGFSNSTPLTFSSSVKMNATDNTYDVFLAKYDPLGNPLWVKSSSGGRDEFGNSLVIDDTGNIYQTGYFENAATTFGTATLPTHGEENAYLVIYNTNGDILLVNALGNQREVGYGIALDNQGSIYIGGGFLTTTVDFGSTTLNNPSAGGGGDFNTFILKLNASLVTGTKEAEQSDVLLYPNPTAGRVIVSTNKPDGGFLKVYSMHGECVYQASLHIASEEIDLSQQPKGIYLFQLQDDSGIRTSEKIVIE